MGSNSVLTSLNEKYPQIGTGEILSAIDFSFSAYKKFFYFNKLKAQQNYFMRQNMSRHFSLSMRFSTKKN